MKKFFLALFVIVSIGEVISTMIELPLLHHICKPLIMLTLGFYYLVSADKEERSATLLWAIFFSFLGDTLLMYDAISPMYFINGLVSFLVAHILYIITYRQHRFDEPENQLVGTQKVRMAMPFILAGTGLVVILYPSLGALRFPVILYALVLVIMVLNALFRYGRTSTESYWLVVIGAILFMISDSLLAINRFVTPLRLGGLWIMVTYIVAQFLIIHGLIRHAHRETAGSA